MTKSQISKMKLKSEIEVSSKEQISELDKEILAIHITESESKLKRKMHLCSYMEEEISIYKILYSGKLLLKSESMKLLNEVFKDFASEIFLLGQEYMSMESLYNSFAQRHHFCEEYQKQVNVLNALGAETEMKLSESEKCFDEFPMFMKIFEMLKETASIKKEKYNFQREEVQTNFIVSLMRIQNEVHLMTDEATHDKDLKLLLLPFSWQALFRSGWLSKSWLETSLWQLKLRQNENIQIEKKCDNFLQFQSKDGVICGHKRKIMLDKEKVASKEMILQGLNNQCFYLETKILHQGEKNESMKSEIVDLENVIQSLEISEETYFEKSYLLQIVHKAGNLLKQKFETARNNHLKDISLI